MKTVLILLGIIISGGLILAGDAGEALTEKEIADKSKAAADTQLIAVNAIIEKAVAKQKLTEKESKISKSATMSAIIEARTREKNIEDTVKKVSDIIKAVYPNAEVSVGDGGIVVRGIL